VEEEENRSERQNIESAVERQVPVLFLSVFHVKTVKRFLGPLLKEVIARIMSGHHGYQGKNRIGQQEPPSLCVFFRGRVKITQPCWMHYTFKTAFVNKRGFKNIFSILLVGR